jgi:hypothetical protein
MSQSVAVAVFVVLDVVLLAGLASVLAAPRKLTPHRPAWLDQLEADFRQETDELLGHDAAQLYETARR